MFLEKLWAHAAIRLTCVQDGLGGLEGAPRQLGERPERHKNGTRFDTHARSLQTTTRLTLVLKFEGPSRPRGPVLGPRAGSGTAPKGQRL
eukprot:9320406-Pyramimonas_sp.AAC.1